MTNKEALNYAVANLDNEEVVAKLEAMIAALERKAENRKPTSKQIENEDFKAQILEYLAQNADGKFTVTEIQNAIPALNPQIVPNQRASAIIRGLVEAGKVAKTVEKRKSYFAIA